MKLIAKRNFRNNLGLDLDGNGTFERHEAHVHVGETFNVGTGKDLKSCTKAEQQIIASLFVAGCVVDPNDKDQADAVAEIESEVKRLKASAVAASKANKANADSNLVEQLMAALKAATAPAAAAK